jgi:hypothetical protein
MAYIRAELIEHVMDKGGVIGFAFACGIVENGLGWYRRTCPCIPLGLHPSQAYPFLKVPFTVKVPSGCSLNQSFSNEVSFMEVFTE